MNTYPLVVRDRHLYVDLGEGPNVLLDTGSPSSFGDLPAGIADPEAKNFIEAIRRHLGREVRGLVGMDWLGRSDFEIDLREGHVGTLRLHGSAGSGRALAAIPRLEASVSGKKVVALLDSGAQYGYIMGVKPAVDDSPEILRTLSPLVANAEVFTIEARLHDVSWQGSQSRCRLAAPPDWPQAFLRSMGVDAILGIGFMQGKCIHWRKADQMLTLVYHSKNYQGDSEIKNLPLELSVCYRKVEVLLYGFMVVGSLMAAFDINRGTWAIIAATALVLFLVVKSAKR